MTASELLPKLPTPCAYLTQNEVEFASYDPTGPGKPVYRHDDVLKLAQECAEMLATLKAALNHCDRETTHMIEAVVKKFDDQFAANRQSAKEKT